MSKLRAGVLGSTGVVGQQFLKLLDNHPEFEVSRVFASGSSSGKKYGESIRYRIGDLPWKYEDLVLEEPIPNRENTMDLDLVFSALPSGMGKLETDFSRYLPLVTKSSSHRLDPDVPLIVPEINPQHLELIEEQKKSGNHGYISADPNCSTTQLAMTLKPLEVFGIEIVIVSTMQALSGSGYPGVPSLDIMGNVIPFIDGEEEKLSRETPKILGTMGTGHSLSPSDLRVIARCSRVPVIDGHTEIVFLKLRKNPTIEEFVSRMVEFRGSRESRELHSSPENPLIIAGGNYRPQPRLDLMNGKGMSVTVGGIRKEDELYTFSSLSHNTIRGAAGGGIQHAELLKRMGYL